MRADHPKIVAWELDQQSGRRSLSIFRLDGGGAKHVYGISVPVDEAEHWSQLLEEQGHRLGQYTRWAPFVWSETDDEIVVWDRDRTCLRAKDGVISLLYDVECSKEAIQTVYSFADSSRVSRGVRATLKNGNHQSLVIHISSTAARDPTYNRNTLLVDTGWAVAVGQALARWAEAPYQRRI